jgi:hypothetical protein
LHYFSGCEQHGVLAGVAQHAAGISFCWASAQQAGLSVAQHAAGGVFCLPANLTVTIVPAERMIKIKSTLFQRFPFF